MQQILKQALTRIKPDGSILPSIEAFRRKLEKALVGYSASVMVGGSIAKDTYLAHDHDCDIFVRFSKEYDNDKLSELLQAALKKAKISYNRIHGSRDYFQIQDGDIQYEIVPIYEIAAAHEAVNVTDCSPLHIAWVRAHAVKIVDGISIADHIRLAKAFCKAHRIYGAESYIGGYSGHMVDILVSHYGGFIALLKASAKWQAPVVVDPNGYYKDESSALKALNIAKLQSPIILIDPTDPSRNASAALTEEKFIAFKNAAADFLKHPALDAFTISPLTVENWGHPREHVIAVSFSPLKGKKDVVGAKMLKAHQFLIQHAQDAGFVIEDQQYWWNGKPESDALSLLYVPQQRIGPFELRRGPPIDNEKALASFRKTHEQVYEEDGRVYASIKRKYTDAKDLIVDLLQSEYVTSRCKKATLM